MITNLFLLAIGAIGWGLSLSTYRMFARHYSWPMGSLHAEVPAIPILLGILAFLAGVLYAAALGEETGGWAIIGCGLLLAAFWIWFLRVGSQVSIFLAPIVTAFLVFGWLAEPFFGYQTPKWAGETVGQSYNRAKQKVKQGIGRGIENLREDAIAPDNQR